MKKIYKNIIQFLLKVFAKIYLFLKKPKVIVVSGTSNKFWIKEKVVEALTSKGFSVRASKKSFNSEIGIPLSILDLPSGKGEFLSWLDVLIKAFVKIFSVEPRIDFLVLEMAVGMPNEMNYLLKIVRPDVVIINGINIIYQENFKNLDEVAEEFKKIIESLPDNGKAFLNIDDERVKSLANYFTGRKIFYSIEKEAEFFATDIKKTDEGQEFKLKIVSNSSTLESFDLTVPRFGLHHVYAQLVKEIILRNY